MGSEVSNCQWLGRMAPHKRFNCLDKVPFPSPYFCPYFASQWTHFGRRNQYADQFQHSCMRQKFESWTAVKDQISEVLEALADPMIRIDDMAPLAPTDKSPERCPKGAPG